MYFELVHREHARRVTHLARCNHLRGRDFNRVQFALDLTFPEIEKAFEFRKVRRRI